MLAAVGHNQAIVQMREIEFGWRPDSTLLSIQDFRIARGERVFLRGPSGSGKSTLLGVIGGVLTPRAGSIQVDGQQFTGRSSAWRDRFRADRIGYIFQMFNLVPYLSVLDNVMLPAGFSTARAQRAASNGLSLEDEARRLLNALGMAEVSQRSRNVLELSQGQQQRVAAARALFGRPALIIADEPTSSLDADTREQFLDLLMSECRHAGSTLLFVSHDVRLSALFDRTVSLSDINSAGGAAPRAVA
jgi:putative ABC transport system ATP-binding protein